MGIAYKYISLIFLAEILSYVAETPLEGNMLWFVRGILMAVAIFDTVMDERRR